MPNVLMLKNINLDFFSVGCWHQPISY